MKRYAIAMLAAAACLLFTACSTPSKNAGGAQSAPETTAEETLENGLPASKQPDPNLPKLDSIIVYSPEADGKLKGKMDAVDTLSEQALLDKLVEYGVLKTGVELVSFDISDESGASEEAGPGSTVSAGPGASGETEAVKTGTLTLSGVEPADGVSADTAKSAIEQTFADNYGLSSVTLVEQ